MSWQEESAVAIKVWQEQDRAVYVARSSGQSWKEVAEDPDVIAAYRARGWGPPGTKGLSAAYARYCARTGTASAGPVKKNTDIRDRAVNALLGAGWSPQDVALAFGMNVKTVMRYAPDAPKG